MQPANALVTIKLLHTIAWAFFAACILAIPFFSYAGNYTASFVLIAIVLVEVGILALNGWRCPLTGVAARYTEDRVDNFDIYLPLWLAKHNKAIFGTLYVVAVVYTLIRTQ